MKRISNVIISYWYKELEDSPVNLVNELENSLNTMFKPPFFVNNLAVGSNLSIPRIETMTVNKDLIFSMSLVNVVLNINNVDNIDDDEMVLVVNEKVQLFYDLLTEIFDVKIVYTSIRVNMTIPQDKACDWFMTKLALPVAEYEDLSLKRVIRMDDIYYFSALVSTGKEISFNISLPSQNKPQDNDLFDRSMIISLQDAKISKEVLNVILEINDRLAYNNDNQYLTNKTNIRGMIVELKKMLSLSIDELINKME